MFDMFNLHYYRDDLIKAGWIALVSCLLLFAIGAVCLHECPKEPSADGLPEEYEIGQSCGFRLAGYVIRGAFTYVKVDGHEYLVFGGFQRFGMTHSPNCDCLKKEVCDGSQD